MTWAIIFWLSVFAILHSYLLYPLIISLLGRRKGDNTDVYAADDNLPFVSIIMSVHNEGSVISEKLRSIFHTSYPEDKIELLVGSDASTDQTNEKLNVYSNEHEALRFFPFRERRGKPAVINDLRHEAMGEILVLTDAQVMFSRETIFELVKHFRNPEIGLVGANIQNARVDRSGISYQEWSFMSREIKMKYYEGKIWGTMIGAYGACYAIRNEYFCQIPPGYSVDDFYITMKVLERNKNCILDLNAVCTENVPNRLSEEFRRKIRISAGNFQNLCTFFKLVWPPWTGLSFSFISHKVLRWIGPFFLLLTMASSIILSAGSPLYLVLVIIQAALLSSSILDFLLRKIGIHIVFLRFITHFFSMNLALLAGFFKFIKGSETNVWNPTKRTAS
jgi:cellulose synthase/poly-beta-1,6-N-acetylglucosamine synthase-like glycosyltransferase